LELPTPKSGLKVSTLNTLRKFDGEGDYPPAKNHALLYRLVNP
jgi:hypothetical protein